MAKKRKKKKQATEPIPKLPNHNELVSDDPHVLLDMVDAYIKRSDRSAEPLTLAGLGLDIGLTREALVCFKHDDQRVQAVISYAMQMVEERIEATLLTGRTRGADGKPVTAAALQFALKSSFNWRDVTEIRHTGDNDNPLGVGVNFSNMPIDLMRELLKWMDAAKSEAVGPGAG